jgi:hypothetical protein
MRHNLLLAALLLPLSGCYVAPQPIGYAQPQPGYPPPPGYPPQPGYPPASYDQDDNIYPGYSENDGAPTLAVDGAVVPLVLFGGGWGYYDGRHNFHRAPDAVSHHLEERRSSGASFHPGGGPGFHPDAGPRPGGGPGFHPDAGSGPRPGGGPGFRPASVPGGQPSGGQSSFRPNPAAAARPAPPPARPERRECPPGQRC